jgi:hypothetical protein
LFTQHLFNEQENKTLEKQREQNKNKRGKLITDVFGTVKNKVIDWFENIDDEPLDS